MKTEGTTGIMEGLYQEYLNSKSKSAEFNSTSKQSTEPKLVPGSIIYAVFTTPQNAIPGSAVCAFKMDDIIESFEGRKSNSFIHSFTNANSRIEMQQTNKSPS